MATRLTATQVSAHRAALLVQQGGKCALCNHTIPAGEAVLDHDHSTGVIRAVLHRGCNAMLGHLENNRPRNKLTDVRKFAAFLSNVATYVTSHTNQPGEFLYHTHRTEDEKRLARNKKARVKRAKEKA